jgi:hypothetical protein
VTLFDPSAVSNQYFGVRDVSPQVVPPGVV